MQNELQHYNQYQISQKLKFVIEKLQYFDSYRNIINSYTHKMSRIKDIQSLKGCGI